MLSLLATPSEWRLVLLPFPNPSCSFMVTQHKGVANPFVNRWFGKPVLGWPVVHMQHAVKLLLQAHNCWSPCLWARSPEPLVE